METHFEVQKLKSPIPVHHNASKQYLRWAVVCVVTGGRFAARKTRAEAELMAGMYGRSACWLCDEAAREDGCVREIKGAPPGRPLAAPEAARQERRRPRRVARPPEGSASPGGLMMRRDKNLRAGDRQRLTEKVVKDLDLWRGLEVKVSLGCSHPRAVVRRRLYGACGQLRRPAYFEFTLPHLWLEQVHANGVAVVRERFVLDAERHACPTGMDACWRCDTVLPAAQHDKKLARCAVFAVRYGGEWHLDEGSPRGAAERALIWARQLLNLDGDAIPIFH